MTKYMVEGIRDGLHLAVKSTVVVLAAGTAAPLPTTALNERKSLYVFNTSGNTIYVGDSAISGSDNGYPILNNNEWTCNASDRNIVYGYCSTIASGVHVFEIA